MATALQSDRVTSRRRRRRGSRGRAQLRLDIQGLRAVAVALVILDHLFGWPRGGFVGVDVFFVISGFLITGVLLRDSERLGHVSFVEFYRRRVRRIVPAATLTLVAIAGTAAIMFSPSRAMAIWQDSIAAFFFVSNWRFAIEGTDYFTADGPLSPVRHFWSLSVEEQFYFVWPAVMAAIVFLVARKALGAGARRWIAGAIMTLLVAVSFAWAVVDTGHNPAWSYFSTLTRAWELGFGALIAIFAASMSAIPDPARPVLAWLGLGLIVFGAFWITEDVGFPGPWATVPVLGSALVIVAGTGGAVRYLRPITNRVSVTIGDLSYSLYLWHWPVIVFLGTYMEPAGWRYYIAALGFIAAFSTLAYYYLEQPVLGSSWLKPRADQNWRPRRRRRDTRMKAFGRNLKSRFTFELTRSREVAALIGILCLAVGLGVLAAGPRHVPAYIAREALFVPPGADADAAPLPPALASFQALIKDAVTAQTWPDLDPDMNSVINGPEAADDIAHCAREPASDCWYGAETAPHTVILAGDSIGMTYVAPLRAFVDASGGQWRLLDQSFIGCPFVGIEVKVDDVTIGSQCPAHKQHVIDNINRIRPDVVLISNSYATTTNLDTQQTISNREWEAYSHNIIGQFADSVGKLAYLTPPPYDKSPTECYRPDRSPAECVGTLTSEHRGRLESESRIAQQFNGELIDTRLLFCTPTNYCPMFVGTTPMKRDETHISPEYGVLMSSAFIDLLRGTTTFS